MTSRSDKFDGRKPRALARKGGSKAMKKDQVTRRARRAEEAQLAEALAAPQLKSSSCHCSECGSIHSEFIGRFGKWPTMTHEEGQALKAQRADNEASWNRAVR